MSFNEVYITNTSVFFPNEPVSNDEMEEYLGFINDKPSKVKRNCFKKQWYQDQVLCAYKRGKVNTYQCTDDCIGSKSFV